MIVLEIVTDSLRRIGVIGQTKTPSAEQGANAVTRLNNLMALLATNGVDLGYNPKASTADTIVLPLGVIHGITAQLSESLAEDYGVTPIPAAVVRDAEESRNMLVRNALIDSFGNTNLSGLPRGQGTGGVYDITTGTWH